MPRIRLAASRWLGAVAVTTALLFTAAARADDDVEKSSVVDDSVSTIGQYYAILCNTCSSTSDFINKAVTNYPRVRESNAYVYNLVSGQIRTIALNWDAEALVQTGGYEVPTDSRLVTYMSYASNLYQRNGNSLSFSAVIRADGSVYLKFPSGATTELRAGSNRTLPSGTSKPTSIRAVTTEVTPGRGSPIDLRGYIFGPYFNSYYPNFPETSYDLAFGDQPGSIDGFVYDYFSTLGQNAGQVFDPDSLRYIAGSSKLTEQVAGTVTLFVPMKDGGYARVRYDTQTGDVMLRQVVDPSGIVLPNGYGNALQFYADRSWNLGGSNAAFAAETFEDWAARNGISVLVMDSYWDYGGTVKCVSRSVNEVTCTILPN